MSDPKPTRSLGARQHRDARVRVDEEAIGREHGAVDAVGGDDELARPFAVVVVERRARAARAARRPRGVAQGEDRRQVVDALGEVLAGRLAELLSVAITSRMSSRSW